MTKALTIKDTEAMSREASKHLRLQRHMLLKGKAPKIGLIEKYRISRQGKLDGSSGLIMKSADGEWTSPFIKREESSLCEYCDKVWGLLQIDNAVHLSRLGNLIAGMEEYRIRSYAYRDYSG